MDARRRLTELLARRAAAGLDDAEARELAGLLASHPEWDNDSFDRAAAALDLALAEEAADLPEEMRRRLRARGEDLVAEESEPGSSRATPVAETVAPDPRSPRRVDGREAPSLRRTGMPPWTGWLAAGAALVIALIAWWPRSQSPPAHAEMRSRLVDDAQDLIRADWRVTDDPAATDAAGGDVVWSSERQRGYVLIRGLRANDPDARQYQLWIFDAARDDRHPVDGGVFDIPRGREQVVIPIDNKLPLERPARFEVTVERPGGVVVSERERVVLLAEVAGS